MPQNPTPREMIERLVGFDTTSRESNLALIGFVAEYLGGLGIKSDIIHDESGNKANLHAVIGPLRDGGVVLSGHTDVVPVDGQAWSTDPFVVREADGKLYGRGTADMKSFIAVALALAPEFLARDLRLPIHLALSYDEEVGCLGALRMVPRIVAGAAVPAVVIVGEPTEMTVVNAHKGLRGFATAVTGLEAHSSATHLGVSAVTAAAELIAHLGGLAEEMKERAEAESRFDPPYTTINVGTVAGGTALNIIAKECTFVWEYRLVPGDAEDEIIDRFEAFARDTVVPRMHAISQAASIVTEERARVRPLVPEDGSPAETLVLALARKNACGAVSYGTEAGIFQGAGMPSVICGPGSIRQAHKPDEFIALSEVEACVRFLRRLADHLAA